MDIAISQRLRDTLTTRFPEDQFFDEELASAAAAVPVTSRFCWVCDPIDGTNNYAKGITHCAISLALLESGLPSYGVIYDLGRRTLIHGGPGRGVWDGDNPAKVVSDGPHGQSLIGFHAPIDKTYAPEGERLIANCKIRSLGSTTLHLAYTAIGLLDGVVDHNSKVWDMAAAAALIQEGGGLIHYLTQSPFPMKEFTLASNRVQYIAGNAAMVARLREVLGR